MADPAVPSYDENRQCRESYFDSSTDTHSTCSVLEAAFCCKNGVSNEAICVANDASSAYWSCILDFYGCFLDDDAECAAALPSDNNFSSFFPADDDGAPSPAPTTVAPNTPAPTMSPPTEAPSTAPRSNAPALAPTPVPTPSPTDSVFTLAPTPSPIVARTMTPTAMPTAVLATDETTTAPTLPPAVPRNELGLGYVSGSLSATGVADGMVQVFGEKAVIQQVRDVDEAKTKRAVVFVRVACRGRESVQRVISSGVCMCVICWFAVE